MLFGFELKLPVWRKGKKEKRRNLKKGWRNFGMTDLGCVRKRNH